MNILFLLLVATLSGQAAAVPAIRWEPFPLPQDIAGLDAQLGRMTVPLRCAHPESGPVELAFVRLRTAGAKSAAPIVYLAGGPGNSGVNAARNPFALPALERLARTADVILLDQRGIGMSSPRPTCAAKPLEPQKRFAASSEMMPRILADTRACVEFPGIDLGDDFRKPIVSGVPVLFISGTLDSNTPPYQAEQVRWGMPHAMHLIVPNAGHEDLEPNEEVQAAIADYFAGKDVASRRIALPVPDFKSMDEAKRERRLE